MKITVTEDHRQRLKDEGLSHDHIGDEHHVGDEAYEKISAIVHRDYQHIPVHERSRLIDHIFLTHPDHAPRKTEAIEPDFGFVGKEPENAGLAPDVLSGTDFRSLLFVARFIGFWLMVIGIALIVLAISSTHAFGQGTSQIDVITFQQSGSPFKSFAAPFKVNCGSGMSCSASGSTVTLSSSGAVGSAAWDTLTAPAGDLSLTMAAHKSTFTFGNATGAGSSLWNFTDTTNNTGTGYLIKINLASGSAASPFFAAVNGNGVAVNNVGLLTAVGTGAIDATKLSGLVPLPSGGTGYASNTGAAGKVLIGNGTQFVEGDPLVQGTKAEGAAIDNPVTIGGKDGSGNNKALVLDSSGRPTVNVNGGVASTIADGADTTLGAKADAKSTATDTTAVTIMQVLKEISAMEQAPASRAVTNAGTFATQATLQAGSAIAGKFGIDQTTPGTTNAVAATNLPTTVDTNSGNKSAGTIRVVIATDQPTQANAQPVSNAGLTDLDSTIGTPASAVPAKAVQTAGTDGTNVVVPYIDPCRRGIKTYYPVNISTATTVRFAAPTASKKTYVCSIVLVAGAADNVNVIEGTGGTCGTATAGVMGGTTAATGPNLAANGGFALGNGESAVLATAGSNVDMCLITSAAVQLSGHITFVQF